MDTTLQKWGNSLGIRIPKAVLDSLHWGGDDSLSLRVEGKSLFWREKISEKRFMNCLMDLKGSTPRKRWTGANQRGKMYGKTRRYRKSQF